MLVQPAVEHALLTCTDGWTTARVRVDCSVQDSGSALVPARRLADTVKLLEDDEVELVSEGDRLNVSCGRFEGSLPLMPVGNFPALDAPHGQEVRVPGADLSSAILKVSPAASRDDSRPLLKGVRLEVKRGFLYLVATDSVRIAAKKLFVGGDDLNFEAVLPRDSLADVARAAAGDEAKLLVGAEVTLSLPTIQLTSRALSGGQYPDWRRFVGLHTSDANQVEVDRLELAQAIRRVSLMADDLTPVRLTFFETGTELYIKSELGEAGDMISDTRLVKGSPWKAAFNPTYLAQALEGCSGDRVRISQADPLKPATLLSGDAAYVYVQMPVRVVGR
jgi:DNA polymerase-3 subunit beta